MQSESIKLDWLLLTRIRKLAKLEGRTIKWYVETAVREYLQRQEVSHVATGRKTSGKNC